MVFGFLNKDFSYKNNKEYYGYSLAEMLIVLVIISVVLISLPHATKKLFTVKEVKTYHGRFECYWNEAGQLSYYYAKERAGMAPEVEEGTLAGNKCEFVPPITYPYIMIHVVGGGGAGGNLTSAVSEPTLFSAYTEYLPDQDYQDQWFHKFYSTVMSSATNQEHFNICSADGCKDVYSTLLTARHVPLQYRKAGGAGAVASVFFPFIPAGNKFYLFPGKGGDLQDEDENGEDGSPSVVQIIPDDDTECDETDSNASCNIIWAKGGNGATVLDTDGNVINLMDNFQLKGGKLSDDGVSAYSDVITKVSGFNDIIDKVNSTEISQSRISRDAGNGGNGANHYVNSTPTGFFFHEFDNFTGSVGKSQGVKWEQISSYINGSVYSSACQNKTSGIETALGVDAFWIKRSAQGDITTQCTPNTTTGTPSYYYCAVGYMKRNVTNPSSCSDVCDSSSKGRCACYTYRYNGTQYGSPITNDGSTVTANYRNPTFTKDASNVYNAYLTVEEKIPSASKYIQCTGDANYKYTVDGTSTPCAGNTEFDTTNGICKAKKGGDGAIVILW